jgi:hypothetical protein
MSMGYSGNIDIAMYAPGFYLFNREVRCLFYDFNENNIMWRPVDKEERIVLSSGTFRFDYWPDGSHVTIKQGTPRGKGRGNYWRDRIVFKPGEVVSIGDSTCRNPETCWSITNGVPLHPFVPRLTFIPFDDCWLKLAQLYSLVQNNTLTPDEMKQISLFGKELRRIALHLVNPVRVTASKISCEMILIGMQRITDRYPKSHVKSLTPEKQESD